MKASDERNLRRMLHLIAATRDGHLTLVNLANQLIFLRDALDEPSREWFDMFTSHIATLESAGLASSDQRALMGDKFVETVTGVLGDLEKLIEKMLRKSDAGAKSASADVSNDSQNSNRREKS